MEFGWYHEFHRQVPGQSDADAFDQGFDDRLGKLAAPLDLLGRRFELGAELARPLDVIRGLRLLHRYRDELHYPSSRGRTERHGVAIS